MDKPTFRPFYVGGKLHYLPMPNALRLTSDQKSGRADEPIATDALNAFSGSTFQPLISDLLRAMPGIATLTSLVAINPHQLSPVDTSLYH